MKKKINLLILLSLFLFTCKTKKDYQLKEIKSTYINKVDSSYIDSITGQITTLRAYTINFDSLGKPTSVNINESITEAKMQVKSGKVNKYEKKNESSKEIAKTVDRTVGKVDISVIFLVLIVVVAIILFYSKCQRL